MCIIEAEACFTVLCDVFCSRHVFLGFTKCGRYVLSYTSDCGEDDDFSFYTYHLYWWEFNLHSRLKQVNEKKRTHSIRILCKTTSSFESYKWRTWISHINLRMCFSLSHLCFFSLGPSCTSVCRRGDLQRPLPDRVWVAKWPLQNRYLWLQVRTQKDLNIKLLHIWLFILQCLGNDE